MSFGCQPPSDLDIIKAGPRQREHLLLHLAVSGQGSHGVDRQQDLQLGGLTATPYAPRLRAVSSGTAQDHLVDQTAQQRLTMLAADRGIGPQFGEALAEGDDLGPQAGIEPIGLGLDLAFAPREGLFGATKRAERRLPAPLKFGRDEPIVGIDAVELPFGETGFVAEPLDLLHLRPLQGLIGVALRLPRSRPGVNLCWRHRRQERGRHAGVDRSGSQTLADRNAVLLAQMVAHVLAAALVAHGHLVPAFAAPGDAVEQRGAVARDASGLVDQILGPVVAQHGLNALESLPLDECRIPVLHDDLPFLERAALVLCPAVPSPPRTHLRAAIAKAAALARALEHRRDRRDGGTPPACLAIAVSPRQRKPSFVERSDDPNGGTALEKGVEHQSDPGL